MNKLIDLWNSAKSTTTQHAQNNAAQHAANIYGAGGLLLGGQAMGAGIHPTPTPPYGVTTTAGRTRTIGFSLREIANGYVVACGDKETFITDMAEIAKVVAVAWAATILKE
jgi:hypothetical protein